MDDVQKKALEKWYSQEWALKEVRECYDDEKWEDVESLVHRDLLFGLSKHSKLPDYMRNEKGKPLFPTNLNPHYDQEGWQDAVEVGWKVMEDRLGITHEEVRNKILAEQNADWEVFLKSVEERKKKKGDSQD